MPKIQFKRKKSTGIGTNKLSAGEPLYNLYDKKLYIGGNASSDETPSKHLTEITVGAASSKQSKISVGEATNNDFTLKAGTGMNLTTSGRVVTIAADHNIVNNSSGATVAFTIDGKPFSHTVAVTIPDEVESAKKLTNARTITLAGDATGSVSFDGSKNVTLSVDVKSADSASKLTTERKIALSGAVTGETTFDGSANKTITTSYAINDAKSEAKIARAVATDADGKLTTTKGSLIGGTGVTIDESGNDLTISAATILENKSQVTDTGTTVAFSINGEEFSQVVAVDGGSLSVGAADKWTTGRKITLDGDVTGSVTIDGTKDVTLTATVKDDSHSHNISATGTDGLMDVTATGGANSVTIAIAPYTSQQSKASFDSSSTAPKLTTRLNYNGDLYATNMYGNNSSGTPTKVVLTDDSRLSDTRTPKSHSHGNITNGGIVGDSSRVVITDANSKITTSSINTTKLGYLTDVTSNIQAQINGKAPTSHKHKVSSTVTSGTPSATVACVNITVANGVLNVSSVTAAGGGHTHSVTITDAETGTPV